MFFVPSRRLQKFSNPRMPREMAKMMGKRKLPTPRRPRKRLNWKRPACGLK